MVGAVGDALTFYTSTNATERVRITSSGIVQLASDAVDFANGTGYITAKGSGDLVFRTTNSYTERLRITSAGKMGVGTASPNHKLTLHDPGTGTFDALNITSGLTNSNGLQLGIDSTSDVFFWHTANGAIKFATNNVERIRVTNGGLDPSTDAVTDLGNSNKRFRDLYLSSGIFLGGTTSSNELDDYEEGSWTPTTTQFAGYTSNGRYTKIGRIVYIEGVIARNTATAPSAVNLQAQSLPFAVNNISSVVSGNYWLDEGGPTTNQGDSVGPVYFAGSSTNVLFVRPTDPSNQASARYVQADEVTNSRGVSFYGWYRV